MKFKPLFCSGIILLFSTLSNAQTPINIVKVGADDFYSDLFNPACSLSGTTEVASPNIASISPISFGNQGDAVLFTITGLALGTTTITITYTSFGSNPACKETPPVTTVLTVTVGPPAAPLTSANTLNAPDAGEPVSAATGELFGQDEMADLSLGGPLGLEFRRYYASYLGSNNVASGLGTNWMHNFDVSLAVSGTSATVTLFRAKTVAFSQSGGAWKLASNEQRPYQLALVAGGGYQFLDPRSSLIYSFTASGALTGIQDRNGNTITVTQGANGPTLASDGLGRTLTFTYTGTNLAGVQDQSGRSVSFQYTNGILSSATDANGNHTTFTYTSNGGVNGLMTAATRPAGNEPFTQTFDASGRVSAQMDSLSNKMTFAYAAGNGGATISEPGGLTLTLANDSNLNLASSSDPTGGTSTYAYDANNRPTATTDRVGNKSAATWDPASGLPASYTDELGNTTSYTYGASTIGPFTFYDLASVRFADGATIALARDSRGNITSRTDQAGNIWQSTYNSNGWLATSTNPSGGVYTYSYNSDGTPATLQLPSSDTTQFGYDGAKRLNLVTNPDTTSRSQLYDALGNVVKTSDERNDSHSFTFDLNYNAKAVTDALAATTTFAFDTDDRHTTTTDSLGNAVTWAWDSQSRLKSVTSAAGNSIAYTYDNLNRVTAVADASGNGFTYGLDGENRPLTITDALSRTVSHTYDAHGNMTGLATPKRETFTASFDALNRLVSTTDPLGRTRQYIWDPRGIPSAAVLPGGVGAAFNLSALGLVSSVTDPVGNVWSRTFDSMGRIVLSSDPLGRKSSFAWDSRQRLATATLPAGTVQYGYDAAGNPTSLKYSDGTSLVYGWDANNRMTSASGLSLSYDAAGRIKNSNGLQITRDAAGRIASVTYAPNKTVTYTYNNRGLVSQVADWVGGSSTFTYDAAGEMTAIAFANGVNQAYTWDADGRVASLTTSRSGTPLSAITLTRDALGRVTSATRSAANIPAEAKGTLALVYDAASQVLGETFDGLGRVTTDGQRNYTWDLASRLTSYTGSDGAGSFTYDGLGQRVSRTSSGVTQNYVWNYGFRLPVLSTVQSGGTDQTYYIWLPNGTLLNSISAADNTRRFYHFDESGSAVLLTDSTGAVTDTYAISIYGDTVSQTGSTANPFTFKGKFGAMREGTTSMYYMRARYYDSGPARFLSRDPLQSGDPRSINPYQFVHANPVEHADARGTDADDEDDDDEAFYDWLDDLWDYKVPSSMTPLQDAVDRLQTFTPRRSWAADLLRLTPGDFSAFSPRITDTTIGYASEQPVSDRNLYLDNLTFKLPSEIRLNAERMGSIAIPSQLTLNSVRTVSDTHSAVVTSPLSSTAGTPTAPPTPSKIGANPIGSAGNNLGLHYYTGSFYLSEDPFTFDPYVEPVFGPPECKVESVVGDLGHVIMPCD